MSKKNIKGSIDLIGIFQNAAISMLHSIEEGNILHRTKNIRDSGALFEQEIRVFLISFCP